MLNLTALRASLAALDNAVQIVSSLPSGPTYPDKVQETLRAGLIQNFEVAYEQSWKMLQRWLAINGGQEVAGITRRHLFRLAAQSLLIDDIDLWMRFNEARNQTSHTYDAAIAQAVLDIAPLFLEQGQRMLIALEDRND